jgi:UDPglucose--hexose-1-phosphate uridylyltransferase
VGRCEVVCFTADHAASFAQLSPERVEVVLEAWTDRTRELGALPGVEHVFVFENRGEEIGITLTHPHGQIYAYPFVPPRTLRMLRSARAHREQTGECLFCALLAAERAAGDRVVAETGRWTAFVPHAARWPFEVHVYPRRHLPDLPALDAEERHELARLHLDVLRRFDGIFGTRMPYIAAWHQAPVRGDRDLAHLYLQVFSVRRAPGKLKYLAGSESAAGVWVNDIAPERAAQLLRDAL